jgi:APA family basic amino acid/polyamine antiporter
MSLARGYPAGEGRPTDGSRATGESGAAPPPFGPATATFLVVSSMIGTGVLTTSGFTVAALGSNWLMLVLWIVGGVLATCGALALSELAAMLPKSGGDYVFLKEAYGPLAGFLSGWVSFLIGFGGPIAAAAAASAKYLLVPLRLEPAAAAGAELATATAVIVALTLVHCRGRRTTIRAQVGMTVLKLVILGTLAAAGLLAGRQGWGNLADRPPLDGPLVVAMAYALVYISYAYTGWNGAAYVAGEVHDPQRRLPRAILAGTGIVTALYLALNLAYALALPAAEIRQLAADQGLDAVAPIAQLAAERLFGPRIADPLAVAIGLTLLASVSACLLTGPRVAAAMADAGQFPAAAGRISAGGAPVVATLLQAGWALVLLWTASFETILVYAGLGLAVFSLLTVGAVFVLRVRRPNLPRPFRTPGYPLVPAIYLLGTAALTAAVAWERPMVAAVSVATIVAGIPVAWLVSAAPAHGTRSHTDSTGG